MKQNKYFIEYRQVNEVHAALDNAIKARDSFVKQNVDAISAIDSEDIKITPIGTSAIILVLTLTYYSGNEVS